MKKIFLCMLPLMASVICFSQNQPTLKKGQTLTDSVLLHSSFFSITEAEKIVERTPIVLKDSIWKNEGGNWKLVCNYWAAQKDSTTGFTPRLFFYFEKYANANEAKHLFALFKSENEKNSPIENLNEVGDEAVLIKDALNSPFIMVLKQNKLFKFKVYYVTTPHSLQQLKTAVTKIVAAN